MNYEHAFPQWSNTSGKERKKVLHRFADLIVERAEEIAMVFFNAYNSDLERLGEPVVREVENSWIVEIAVSDPIRPALGMPEEGTFVIEMRKSNCQILDLAVR
mgnify:CR=1 FL=1